MTNYTDMDATTMLAALGTDASKWATAFNQHAVKLGYSSMDEGWLIGWFANAMCAAHDRMVDNSVDKVLAMDTEQIRALSRLEGSSPELDAAKAELITQRALADHYRAHSEALLKQLAEVDSWIAAMEPGHEKESRLTVENLVRIPTEARQRHVARTSVAYGDDVVEPVTVEPRGQQ
jgi:hypothetical protein